jgi:hypothetical protein
VWVEEMDPGSRSPGKVKRLSAVHSQTKEAWEKESKFVRDKYGLPSDSHPLTGKTPPPALRGVARNPRVLELLDIAEGIRLQTKTPASEFFINVSQNVARTPFGKMHCLTIGSQTYDPYRDQCLTGLDRMALMGMPCNFLGEQLESGAIAASERDLGKFAGQAMCAPCLGAVFVSVFLQPCGPWWVPRRAR